MNITVSPLGALFLIFMILKLCGVIAWSWWWVTAPLWAVPVLFVGSFLIPTVLGGIALGIIWVLRKFGVR